MPTIFYVAKKVSKVNISPNNVIYSWYKYYLFVLTILIIVGKGVKKNCWEKILVNIYHKKIIYLLTNHNNFIYKPIYSLVGEQKLTY